MKFYSPASIRHRISFCNKEPIPCTKALSRPEAIFSAMGTVDTTYHFDDGGTSVILSGLRSFPEIHHRVPLSTEPDSGKTKRCIRRITHISSMRNIPPQSFGQTPIINPSIVEPFHASHTFS